MSRPISLIKNSARGADERKRTIERNVKVGPVTLRALTIASIASLLLFYLAQTTQSATKQYEIQALERSKQELSNEVDRLELEALRLQSLRAIEDSVGNTLQPVENVRSVE